MGKVDRVLCSCVSLQRNTLLCGQGSCSRIECSLVFDAKSISVMGLTSSRSYEEVLHANARKEIMGCCIYPGLSAR